MTAQNRLAVAERSGPPVPHDQLDRFPTGQSTVASVYQTKINSLSTFCTASEGSEGARTTPPDNFLIPP